MKVKKKPATSAKKTFTEEERAAIKERAREAQAGERRAPSAGKADGESELRAKIAEMQESDRVLAKRIHGVVKASAPELTSTTWYGMPAYAKEGKIICFFQSAQKLKTRYATLGFNAPANLDEGAMWPVAFAVTKLTAADDARIAALVKKAIS